MFSCVGRPGQSPGLTAWSLGNPLSARDRAWDSPLQRRRTSLCQDLKVPGLALCGGGSLGRDGPSVGCLVVGRALKGPLFSFSEPDFDRLVPRLWLVWLLRRVGGVFLARGPTCTRGKSRKVRANARTFPGFHRAAQQVPEGYFLGRSPIGGLCDAWSGPEGPVLGGLVVAAVGGSWVGSRTGTLLSPRPVDFVAQKPASQDPVACVLGLDCIE